MNNTMPSMNDVVLTPAEVLACLFNALVDKDNEQLDNETDQIRAAELYAQRNTNAAMFLHIDQNEAQVVLDENRFVGSHHGRILNIYFPSNGEVSVSQYNKIYGAGFAEAAVEQLMTEKLQVLERQDHIRKMSVPLTEDESEFVNAHPQAQFIYSMSKYPQDALILARNTDPELFNQTNESDLANLSF